jgi:hypothetical protein
MAPHSSTSCHNTFMVKHDACVFNTAISSNAMNSPFVGAYPNSSNTDDDIELALEIMNDFELNQHNELFQNNLDLILENPTTDSLNPQNNDFSFDSNFSFAPAAIKNEPIFMPFGAEGTNNSGSFLQETNDITMSTAAMPSYPSKSSRRSSSKAGNSTEVSYGPLVVRPRKTPAPTLSSGRRSKYELLSDEEERKRQMRRDRNRMAANKCKNKRVEIESSLEKERNELKMMNDKIKREFEMLQERKRKLLQVIESHSCKKRFTEQQMNTVNTNSQYNFNKYNQSSNYSL